MRFAWKQNLKTTNKIWKLKYLQKIFNINNTKTKLVYRKEQFPATKTNYLPAEYIIRDKRYTMDEITNLVVQEGFKVIDSRYVQAGKFSKALTNTDPSAKEILLICQKCD